MLTTDLYLQLSQFYQENAAAIDQERWDDWMAMFSENCIYCIQSRENFDRNLPMAALSLESKGMLKTESTASLKPYFTTPIIRLM